MTAPIGEMWGPIAGHKLIVGEKYRITKMVVGEPVTVTAWYRGCMPLHLMGNHQGTWHAFQIIYPEGAFVFLSPGEVGDHVWRRDV